jgi:hypothetical protein
MLIKVDCMSPPAAAGAVWAKAEEMNTGKLQEMNLVTKSAPPEGADTRSHTRTGCEQLTIVSG